MPAVEPVTWMKLKYACPKDKGRYKGGTNALSKKSDRKRKKTGGGPHPIEHVMVLDIDKSTYWITRPREGSRK